MWKQFSYLNYFSADFLLFLKCLYLLCVRVFSAFAPGHCYEPFVKYGNFTSSDMSYGVGAVVEFSCNPGYTLEQGSVIIECMDPKNPQWNETEPACRGMWLCVWLWHTVTYLWRPNDLTRVLRFDKSYLVRTFWWPLQRKCLFFIKNI